MGPIWDFDIAFGSDNGFCDGMNRHAWVFQYNQYCSGDAWLVPFWWKRLVSDEAFKNKLIVRWKALRAKQLSDNQEIIKKLEAQKIFDADRIQNLSKQLGVD
jgi:hypothetical protein